MTKRGAHRHKSSYSGGSGSCVEVAEGRAILVRDTQNRELGHIGYTPGAWAAFLHCATLTKP
jgi:hypothetical protein